MFEKDRTSNGDFLNVVPEDRRVDIEPIQLKVDEPFVFEPIPSLEDRRVAEEIIIRIFWPNTYRRPLT